MKLSFCKKILISATSITMLPFISFNYLTSCHHEEQIYSIKSIDGHDWDGCSTDSIFLQDEYEVNIEQKTVTYLSSSQISCDNHLIIPEYVVYNGENYKVVLGPKCFLDNSKIRGTIEFNKFTTEISDQCFASINKFLNINCIIFKEYPTKIGEQSFYGCHLLESIYVKKDGDVDSFWTKKLESVGDLAFYECDLSYSQPSGGNLYFFEPFKYLGKQSFYKTKIGFVSFTFANGLKEISDGAFSECTLLLGVEFGKSISMIGARAFDACNLLKQVYLPEEGMTFEISELSFANCSSLENFSKICYFTKFPKSCFANCSSLQRQLWMDGPSKSWQPKIYESAFEACYFRTIKFRTNTLQPETKSFGSYGGSTKVQDGIIIDFTECDLSQASVPIAPSWKSLVDPSETDRDTKILQRAIFTDKPSCGRLRFKGDATTELSSDWDQVFEALGLINSDFSDEKWKIEFIQ